MFFGGTKLTLIGPALVAATLAANASAQSIAPGFGADFGTLHTLGSSNGRVTQMAFAPGDNQHLYVATYGQGILRFDYDPFAVTPALTNRTTVVPASITDIGGVNGSLGLAFHQDPVLGTVMYVAPAVPFIGGGGEDTLRNQSIIRLTDTNNDGLWGSAGDVNQAIVNNLEVTELHEVNQMQVYGDTLFVGIGSRTQNGGITTPGQGDQSHPGETAYTGTVSFIENLTALSGDTSTPNVAGFAISNHKTDVQTFTSTDPGKLRVYSTGLRNVYGLRTSPEGELWLTFNQNESPQLPDELHQTFFQADHGFEKRNDLVGDWKAGVSPSSQAALNAGYMQEEPIEPTALLGNNAAAGGFDFITSNANYLGDMVVSRWVYNDVALVDRETGNTQVLATGFNRPLDVLRDPVGNLLVGENVGSGRIFRIDVIAADTPLILEVDRDSGEVALVNQGDGPIEFDGYTIFSGSGALAPEGWMSLEESGTLGSDWRKSPPLATRLSELKEDGVAALAEGMRVALGAIFSPASETFGEQHEDLLVRYATPGGELAAAVRYTGTRLNTLLLEVDPTTGAARLRNTSEHTVSIDAYTISSDDDALRPEGWNSLDVQGAAGGDWSASPGTSSRLSELKESDGTALAPGALFELGTIFDVAGERDLQFEFLLENEEPSLLGRVLYNEFANTLFGDYNDDGIVDAADYTLWRDHLGTRGALANDQSPGSVGPEDYEVWKANFGSARAGGVEQSAQAPEPGGACLLLVACFIKGFSRRARVAVNQ